MLKISSKQSIGLLVAAFSTILLLVTSIQAAPASLDTILLSDTAQTNGSAVDPNVLPDSESIHVFWKEHTGTNEGYDLFYRKLPFGNTKNLSDHSLTEGDSGVWDAQLSSDGNVAVIWAENTPSGNSDLFFWRNSSQQPLNLSSTASTTGNTSTYLYQLLLDSNGKAHVLWAEEPTMTPFDQDLLYWSEVTGLTQNLSPVGVGGGIVSELTAKIVNNIVYVSWSEYVGPAQTFNPFYWNSSAQTRVNLSNLTDSFSVPTQIQMAVTTTNEAHVFWLENVSASAPNICPFYWNSTTGVTESLIENANDCQTRFIEVKQHQDQIYAVWDDELAIIPNNGVYYWQVGSPSKITVSETIQESDFGFNTPSFLDPTTGKVHLTWITQTFIEGHDVFYWNSVDQTVQNISDHGLTSDNRAEEMIKLVDSTGILHIFWLETADNTTEFEDLFYWNSSDQNTIQLSDPTLVTSDARHPVAVMDSNNEVYVIWRELKAGSNDLGLFYWDSISAETKALPITPNAAFDLNYDIEVGATNTVHVAWSLASGVTGEGADVYYWDGANGSTHLSDSVKTQGDSGVPIVSVTGMNKLFITWPESDDLFSAFEPVILPYKTYLPLVLNE
ncbi:MAG: hypothetical protein IPM53_16065 [Anaerolineaceae bacterium]|nr:hypothetical protein [Anaerolineaceae bacterium]